MHSHRLDTSRQTDFMFVVVKEQRLEKMLFGHENESSIVYPQEYLEDQKYSDEEDRSGRKIGRF